MTIAVQSSRIPLKIAAKGDDKELIMTIPLPCVMPPSQRTPSSRHFCLYSNLGGHVGFPLNLSPAPVKGKRQRKMLP